jgi:hypothetical protein
MITPERLLHQFNAGHLGTAHGIAKVLAYVADYYAKSQDPLDWEPVISRQALLDLAGELTADLPAPYGRVLK